MSAFPPQDWPLPLDEQLITSRDPSQNLLYQQQLVRAIQDINRQISNAIYGEKAKFLPVAQGGTSAGTGTYEVQVGQYVRFGSMVWFTINLEWDDANHTGTGDLEITGLPVSSHNLTNGVTVVNVYNSQSGSEFVGAGLIQPAESKISAIQNGGTTQQINGADYDLQITGIYRAL